MPPLLFWKTKDPQIDAFAQQLANRLFSELPPALVEKIFTSEAEISTPRSGAKKKPGVNAGRITEEVGRQLRQFSQQSRLGIYGKARLHMQFRSRLIELGYSKGDARAIDQLILFQGI